MGGGQVLGHGALASVSEVVAIFLMPTVGWVALAMNNRRPQEAKTKDINILSALASRLWISTLRATRAVAQGIAVLP